jgi:hypothetical protein
MLRKKLALDNSRINALVTSPEVVREFQFFALKLSKQGCCGKSIQNRPDYDTIRATIISLSPERRNRLKELLKTEQLTVYLRVGNTVRTESF